MTDGASPCAVRVSSLGPQVAAGRPCGRTPGFQSHGWWRWAGAPDRAPGPSVRRSRRGTARAQCLEAELSKNPKNSLGERKGGEDEPLRPGSGWAPVRHLPGGLRSGEHVLTHPYF